MTGYMVSDDVCLDTTATYCANDFDFLAITSEQNFDWDGILGLSPPAPSNGPSYIKALYDSGVISEYTATFWLNLDSVGSSTATFGGVPDGATLGDTFTQELVQDLETWWTVSLGSVTLGGQNIKPSGTQYAAIDSGSSLLIMPPEDYENFLD